MRVDSPSYLVQILLPKERGGEPVSHKWFEGLLQELTDRFGGATSFARTPGQGLWDSGGEVKRDNIAIIEVMAERFDSAYWQSLRARLEQELSQDEIVIRAQEIIVV